MRDITQHIIQNWQHLKSNPIYVACSGGLDSTVLLSVLHANNFNVNAIHVNYHLRGEDSNLDEAFIRDFCQQQTIPFEVKSVALAEKLADAGNLQQLAREIRYNWFEEIISKNNESYIFLAHHLDDQVETFFLNLARKSGVMGLACMPYERNNIVRPFLQFSKADLKAYAIENEIKWSEDVSNETNKYRRNFLRNEILPYISSHIPDLNESVLLLIQKFQEKQKELEVEIEPVLTKIHASHQVDFETIKKLDEFQLNEIFRQIGQPNKKALELISLLDTQKGKKVELLSHLSNPFTAIVRDENVFSFISESAHKVEFQIMVEHVNTLPSSFNKNEIYLDAEKIEGELKIRTWQKGDRIHSIGMEGSQLISDVISDAKLSALEKQNVLIVHDNSTIHWCVGMKVGRKAVASNYTQKVLKITISKG
jgi:tRNA(Ile)-lysidine synthase